jgi:HK97 family phage major capsid protein
MPTAFLRSKIDERAALTDLVEGIYTQCNDQQRDPSQEERAKLDDYSNRIKVLDGSITELRTAEEANSRFLSTAAAVEDSAERIERGRTQPRQTEQTQAVSAGQAFIDSEQFRSYRGRGTMEPVEFQNFLGLEQRAAIAGPITEDLLNIPPTRWDGPAGPYQRTPFLSAIGREQVSTNSVSYITWGPATGATVVAETDTKPEATLTPTETPATLQTYAYWKAITRQALEDYPRIRSIVETKLRQGLAQTLEAAAVAVLAGVAAPDAETNLEGVRLAMAELQGKGYTPTAIAANPTDAAYLDLAVMNGTLGGPASPGSFWGLRVLPVPGITAGKAYVGDLQNAVTWFDRGSASVYMSDSHADYFIRNLFVILAEERSAFALTEPEAIEAVTIVLPTPPVQGLRSSGASSGSSGSGSGSKS